MNEKMKKDAISKVCLVLDENDIKYKIKEQNNITYEENSYYESIETLICTSGIDAKKQVKYYVIQI